MGHVAKNPKVARQPKDRQLITLLTKTELDAFIALCDANQMNRSEMLRHLVRIAIRPQAPVPAFDPTGPYPTDPDGLEYSAVVT